VRSLEDEIPFDIPRSWEWVTLKMIAISELGKTLDKEKNRGDLKPYLCSINVYWDGIDLTKVKEARFEDSELPKYRLQPGDLLICEGGDVGRSAVWTDSREMYYQNALHRVRFYGGIDPFYFQLLLECYKGNKVLEEHSKGMTIKHLVQSSLNSIYFPLPPLAEQKRIVQTVVSLSPYLQKYNDVESELYALNNDFPNQLRKAILQMAIQGKLVPQDPSDEPAPVLLERIRAEKQRLVNDRKIKKDRHESIIFRRDNSHYEKLDGMERCIDDEIPFDIPDTWEWVRLGSVVDMLSGFAFKSTDFRNKGRHRLLRGINLGVGNIRWDETVYVDEIPEKLEIYQILKNDVLIGLDRPWISGGIRVAIYDETEETYLVQRVLRIRKTRAITEGYIALILHSNLFKNSVEGQTTGISVPHISPTQVGNVAIPLPPIAEQKRIITQIEFALKKVKTM